MPTTSTLDLQDGGTNRPRPTPPAIDLHRETSTKLAALHNDNKDNLDLLIKIAGELEGRTSALSVNTLALVRQDIERLRGSNVSVATRDGTAPARKPRHMWARISLATIAAAILIGFAQGLGGQLWAYIWQLIAPYLQKLTGLFG